MPGILSELRVLELTHRPSGAFCAKLLADQGADTVKVEPPGWGDQARHEPPFVDDVPDPDRGTSYLAFNTNKRGITLDVEQADGRELFERLAATADIIVESYPSERLAELGLSYEQLSQANLGLILVSITYFGQDGPYAGYQGDDLVAQAMGGYLYAVTGSASRPPMGTALQQMEITAARNGAVAAMAALLRREQSGKGAHIDVSTMEAAVSTPSGLIHPYTYTGRNPHRGGSDGNVMDGMHLPTLDGEVTLTTAGTGGRPMAAWAEFLEEPGLLDAKFASRGGRMEHWEELHGLGGPQAGPVEQPGPDAGDHGPGPGHRAGADAAAGGGIAAPGRARVLRRDGSCQRRIVEIPGFGILYRRRKRHGIGPAGALPGRTQRRNSVWRAGPHGAGAGTAAGGEGYLGSVAN